MGNAFFEQALSQSFIVVILLVVLHFMYQHLKKMMSENEARTKELEERIELLHKERKEERAELVALTTGLRTIIKENSTFIEKLSGIIEASYNSNKPV